MDKVRLIKLIRLKIYWEKERDKCLLSLFFFFILVAGLSFKAKNYPGIKKIDKIGWTNSSGWEKFNYIFDWFLIIVAVIYLLFAIYYLKRIQVCYSKLDKLNQKLLEELNNLSETDIKLK